MRRRLLALGGAAVLVAAACSSGTHRASPPSTTAPASATAAPNPDVIPPVITVAYVNAVFAVLNHIYGNATRVLRATHAVTPEVKADLRAIFNDPLYAEQVQAANLSLRQGVINNVRLHPGDLRTVVTRLIRASSSCIFAETKTDFSAAFVHATPQPAAEYFALSAKKSDSQLNNINPTPWAFAANEAYLSPTTVADPCAPS
jgi:hypothetical protein